MWGYLYIYIDICTHKLCRSIEKRVESNLEYFIRKALKIQLVVARLKVILKYIVYDVAHVIPNRIVASMCKTYFII